MKIVEIRYDRAPHLSQTVGPFIKEETAETYKEKIAARLVADGWRQLPAPTTMSLRPGDGFVARLQHPKSKQYVVLQVRQFERPQNVDETVNLIDLAANFLPTS